jgi:hypothetical protein
MTKTGRLLSAVLVVLTCAPLQTSWVPLSITSPRPSASYLGNHDFKHQTGQRDPLGWGAYYRHHIPGLLISGLKNGGERLPKGAYRYDFYFARRLGHFSNLLSGANETVRLEVYDVTAKEVIAERTLVLADLLEPRKKFVRKSLSFSSWERSQHRFEPRIYWKGMAGIALSKITRVNLEAPTPRELKIKGRDFEDMMRTHFLDRGYVIVRSGNNTIEDKADAAIWTGMYAATQALRYKSTHDPDALRKMEASLWALHRLAQAAPISGTLVRYIDKSGTPLPEAASKDTYTGFFYAIGQCLPSVKDAALRKALLADTRLLANHLLDHNLSFQSSYGNAVDLKPYLSKNVFTEAYEELRHRPSIRKKWVLFLNIVRWYFGIHGQKAPAGLKRIIELLTEPNADQMEKELLPIVNDLRLGIRKLQQNVHRSALRGAREGLTDTPYGKLDVLLLRMLANLDQNSRERPFERLEDLKILPSQSLHSLHFIKVAAEALPKPNRFSLYYKSNLYEGMSLLRTAVQWHQIDEDLLAAVRGEAEASVLRGSSAHLGYLALHNLILLEQDPLTRFQYQKLFEARYRTMRNEGNAMADAMHSAIGLSAKQMGLVLWALGRYPVDRVGKGEAFWEGEREALASAFGGIVHRRTRDPIPVDLRPRDAFIWQRSARAIRGDHKDWLYPPLDYLFAYWLARSAASLEATAEKS